MVFFLCCLYVFTIFAFTTLSQPHSFLVLGYIHDFCDSRKDVSGEIKEKGRYFRLLPLSSKWKVDMYDTREWMRWRESNIPSVGNERDEAKVVVYKKSTGHVTRGRGICELRKDYTCQKWRQVSVQSFEFCDPVRI